ncbi:MULTISPECIES: SigE family RNA polymerase sigma factor [Actinoplanes]|uniref:RNA polymerase subunit sigma-24 n=2 Tax=Actinoplanes TaxID=1865 RepID=A0A101JTC0_9ACTN|nr:MULTISPECIES: SigE family RNA polymerase sigma factor [Actinoplanes]KUL32642.1 RNA polymerase subunit sigma-24 [Actinoplanes awajinensis subsp. mycoplanecinus]GIE70149.1 RNA polymerase sigma24 factor [Actinoplanes palleronii]
MRSDLEREYVDYVAGRLPRLHRAAYLLCADRYQADDIVQATVTALYMNWKSAVRADNLDGFVHRILVRRYLDERRRRWSRVLLGDHLPERPGPADTRVEARDELLTALRALPKGQRAVVVLRYFSDLSVEATAAALGCSVGNVKSQCSRGLAALRAELGAFQESR